MNGQPIDFRGMSIEEAYNIIKDSDVKYSFIVATGTPEQFGTVTAMIMAKVDFSFEMQEYVILYVDGGQDFDGAVQNGNTWCASVGITQGMVY